MKVTFHSAALKNNSHDSIFFFFPILFFFFFWSPLTIHRKWRHLQQLCFFGKMLGQKCVDRPIDASLDSRAPLPPPFHSDRLTRPPTLLPTQTCPSISPLSRNSSSSAFNFSRTNAHDGNVVG